MTLLLALLLQAAVFNGPVVAEAFLLPDGSVVGNSDRTRVMVLLVGSDSGGLLSEYDDQRTFYQNLYAAPLKIEEVRCFTDAGLVSINLQRDDGTPSDILSAPLVCTRNGSKTTTFTPEGIVNPEDMLDYHTVTADGIAHRVTILVKATIQ